MQEYKTPGRVALEGGFIQRTRPCGGEKFAFFFLFFLRSTAPRTRAKERPDDVQSRVVECRALSSETGDAHSDDGQTGAIGRTNESGRRADEALVVKSL